VCYKQAHVVAVLAEWEKQAQEIKLLALQAGSEEGTALTICAL
jgi:hypothetical protein